MLSSSKNSHAFLFSLIENNSFKTNLVNWSFESISIFFFKYFLIKSTSLNLINQSDLISRKIFSSISSLGEYELVKRSFV